MELERTILQTLEEFMKRLGIEITNMELKQEENGTYRVNLEAENANQLIGPHGENLIALQHMVKLMLWRDIDENAKTKKLGENEESFSFVLDIENYRKKQEENVLKMAEQKAEVVRKTRKNQVLPPMSPYFRRLIHLHFTKPEYGDLETVSSGEGDFRQVTIRSKVLIEE